MKTILMSLLFVTSIGHAAVYVPQEFKIPCYQTAILSAQEQTVKTGWPISETSIATAKTNNCISTFVVVIRAEFEEEANSEENDVYYGVDILRRAGKCEVLGFQHLSSKN